MVSNLQPQQIDFESEWTELRKNLDLAFDAKLPRHMYTEQYGRVYKICVAFDAKSVELYHKISLFLEERADFISNGLDQLKGADLLEQYCNKWNSYKRAANETNNICRYLNINHIESKNYECMEVSLAPDLDDMLAILDLSYEKWKNKVLSKIDTDLVDACLQFMERMRMGEILSKQEQSYVKEAILSFSEVCHYRRRNPLSLYQEKFEIRFLEETSKFYVQQARKFLENGDVGNYMTQVLKVLQQEERRAFHFLDRSTMDKQKERIEQSLIHDRLDVLFDEAETMVANENADHLHKLYQLLKSMENPLNKLVKMFKSYVEKIGKNKIKEAKTPREFVDIVCAHYDNFRTFVDNVFVDKSTFAAIPDKNFIESLKDAMRTIVNHKETEKDRSKTPELLAQYSDQLLKDKKRESGEIESKLDEIIKCLEFVSEKDLFQGNYTRRLAKRLIFGLSSNTESEGIMIDKLKTVCVYEFSSKIKRMYEDIKNSAIQQEEFDKDPAYNQRDFHIDVKVLQDGCWPFPRAQPNFNLPSSLEQSVKDYTKFYTEKHTNRTLKWFYNHSIAELRMYCQGGATGTNRKMYVLKVTTFQLAILHQFNINDKLTTEQIKEQTALDEKELMKQLKPCIENDVLKVIEGNKGGDLTSGNILLLAANDDFVKRGTTVKLVPSNKDKGDSLAQSERHSIIQSVEEDRRYWVHACIARLLKEKKQINYTDLIGLIQKEAGNRFQPTIQLIKNSIEVLIEKSFIERKPDSHDTYLYVA
jgi:cullin 2